MTFLTGIICLVGLTVPTRADATPPPLATDGPDEIARVARSFNAMSARLAAQEAERTFMLAGISHDLRTPLAKLRLELAMVQGITPDAEAAMARQFDRLDTMLTQFLDFARGFADEPVQPCDVRVLLEAVAHDCNPEGAVSVDVPKELYVPLRSNAVSRAVGNLVGNALRHGEEPVTVAARTEGAVLEIAVSDAGEGFDAAQAQQLLRPFARGDSARGGDGAGLGLAIVERVAQVHSGSLSFEWRQGRFCAVLQLLCR